MSQCIGNNFWCICDENHSVARFAAQFFQHLVEHFLLKKLDDWRLQFLFLNFDPSHPFGAICFGNFRQIIKSFTG